MPRSFEDLNKEYNLLAAQLGELELKNDELREAMTNLANEKVQLKKQVNKLRIEAKNHASPVDPSSLTPVASAEQGEASPSLEATES